MRAEVNLERVEKNVLRHAAEVTARGLEPAECEYFAFELCLAASRERAGREDASEPLAVEAEPLEEYTEGEVMAGIHLDKEEH